MKASPVQLLDAQVVRCHLVLAKEQPITWSTSRRDFDFDNVEIEIRTGLNRLSDLVDLDKTGEGVQPDRDFVVELGFRTPGKNAEAARRSPIDIDVRVQGIIRVAFEVEAEKVEMLAAVNGLALMYGLIRETVGFVTGRMPGGRLTLPTVNFLDDARVLVERLVTEHSMDTRVSGRSISEDTAEGAGTSDSSSVKLG